MAAFKDSIFVGPVPCIIAPQFRQFLMRNKNMSFAEVTGEMKLAMHKSWHMCFVTMDLSIHRQNEGVGERLVC